jgi:hypothetical protein
VSITTYSELQTAVGNWLGRSDLTSRIPEFISLAEAKLNRVLKSQAQETKSTSFSITAEYVNVPSDFIESRNFYVTSTDPDIALQYMAPDEMSRYSSTGKPKFYAVVGSQFRFAPAPDGTYTSTLIYYAKLPALASNSTNWLLTSHPDAYLYGSLLEAEAYGANDQRVGLWKQGYDQVVAEINGVSQRGRYGAPMAARPG